MKEKAAGAFAGKSNKIKGFTLIELIVVLAIMSILALTVNLAQSRADRNIRLAANRLVSDIRKVQSYTLSSRILPSGESAQYYILKFDLNNPNQYVIQAVVDAATQPKLYDIETINLPQNVGLRMAAIRRPLFPTTQAIVSNCVLAAFAAPFGKIIFNDGCNAASPPILAPSDDYYANIINFQSNVACLGIYDPTTCSASTDSKLALYVYSVDNNVEVPILINSITGSVCPMDPVTWACKASF